MSVQTIAKGFAYKTLIILINCIPRPNLSKAVQRYFHSNPLNAFSVSSNRTEQFWVARTFTYNLTFPFKRERGLLLPH